MAIQDADFDEALRQLRRNPALWLALDDAERLRLKELARDATDERGEIGGSR